MQTSLVNLALAAQQTAAAPAAGGGDAAAGPMGCAGGGSVQSLVFMLLMFAVFWFILIRPQQKKQKELDNKLKKGDRVFTNAGIVGKIVELNDRRVTLEVSKGVNMVFLRTAIGGLDEGDPAKTEGDKGESKSTEKRA